MFANLKFRNIFSLAAPGIPPQLYATGSTGGTVLQVTCANATSAGPAGNYMNFKKWVYIVQTGSGAVTTLWNAWIGGASASNGTFSMLPSSSTSTFSGSATYGNSAQYASAATLVMEVRGEYISGLSGYGSGVSWIRPIVSITTASAYMSCLALAFDAGTNTASFGDYNPAVNGVSQYVLQETDAF